MVHDYLYLSISKGFPKEKFVKENLEFSKMKGDA